MSTITNIYKNDIDFATLALQDRHFAKVLNCNGQLDFSDPNSVQQLTRSLLKRDFGLTILLPPDRLCPPVPNRLNYVLWIQRLLDTTSDSYNDVHDPAREVVGLDIGTGASCIYPMLGCAQRKAWKFIGTDIDDKSLQFAKQNVQYNGLQGRIRLLKTQPDGHMLPLDDMNLESIDFCMCNPPFYSSAAEMLISASTKQRPPYTACTGSANEMVTPGGEIAFISRIIDESLLLKERVQWYSSMLGKYSSIEALVKRLKDNGIDNYAITEFVQGSKTRRWGIAWSFEDLRPPAEVARAVASLQKSLLPFPPEFLITSGPNQAELGSCIDAVLSELPLKWIWKEKICTGLGLSDKAVWSRAARRHIARQPEGEKSDDDEDMSFVFKIHVADKGGGVGGSSATVRWLRGHDSVLFESFCGMLKRKVEEHFR